MPCLDQAQVMTDRAAETKQLLEYSMSLGTFQAILFEMGAKIG